MVAAGFSVNQHTRKRGEQFKYGRQPESRQSGRNCWFLRGRASTGGAATGGLATGGAPTGGTGGKRRSRSRPSTGFPKLGPPSAPMPFGAYLLR